MTASVSSPADVVNLALRRIGYKLRVGQLYDGSKAANNALDVYAQTRDALLRQSDWGFAERSVSPVLLKSAPAGGYVPGVTTWDPALYPPLNARFEYAWPDDCLKVRAIKPAPLFVPNFDPQPHSFRIANDATYNPVKRVILCNVADAVLIYTGQVTDPAAWDADFVEAFAASLARRLAPSLASLQAEQVAEHDEMRSTAVAEMQQG